MQVLRSSLRDRQASKLSVLALLVIWTALIQATQEQMYTIDPAHSSITVQVGKSGAFSFAGHTHEVVGPVSGRVGYNAGDPARSTIALDIDASQLRVTGQGEPAGDVAEVQQTMLSDHVLDAQRFRKIVFESRQVSVTGRTGDALTLRITGDLTLHGVTKPQTVTASATIGGRELSAQGTTTVKQTDYGMRPVTAGGGTVRVKDELAVAFSLVARR